MGHHFWVIILGPPDFGTPPDSGLGQPLTFGRTPRFWDPPPDSGFGRTFGYLGEPSIFGQLQTYLYCSERAGKLVEIHSENRAKSYISTPRNTTKYLKQQLAVLSQESWTLTYATSSKLAVLSQKPWTLTYPNGSKLTVLSQKS